MDHGTEFHSAAEDWECIRAQSWQARKGSAGFSCCCTVIAGSLLLSWTWKWRILRYIDIGFVWRRFGCLGSASCLLVHSCSPCEFSSECLLPSKMTELGMQCFFFNSLSVSSAKWLKSGWPFIFPLPETSFKDCLEVEVKTFLFNTNDGFWQKYITVVSLC